MADSTLIIIQLWFILFIFLLGITFGIIPNKVPWCKNSTTVLGIANAFSGGVFLAIAFLHVLPEVAHNYDDYMNPDSDSKIKGTAPNGGLKHGDDNDYFPLPFALAFAGYAFILLIDKVVFDTHSLIGEHHHGHTHDPVQENFIQNAKSSFIKLQKMVSGDTGIQKNSELTANDEAQIVNGIKQYLSRNDKFAVRMSVALRNGSKNKISKTFVHNAKGLEEGDEQAAFFADKNNIDFREPMNKVDLEANHDHHDHDHDHDHHKSRLWACNLTPVVLMIALSTHSMFEGIAVGVAESTSEFWTLAMAIALHKWCEAMSLGISMSKNFKNDKRVYTVVAL